ncbi:hypothetical protein [Pontimicrobium aquaticum]|uniref:Uncharacterized protein n=1 Tax=Pontimicrobium aquaticum TaxID=2565367 RepID=A0A4U0ESU2_9FLAO|nr:hypothetical protein [Pontimicrobium aquaticum]TJY34823.1 hypothetical protein E5167_11000 [Pontimicrobium aquaticum]
MNIYAPLLIGQSIEPPNNYPITNLEIQEYEENNYRLVCRVAEYAGVTIVADVVEVAERHGLILPIDALNGLEDE